MPIEEQQKTNKNHAVPQNIMDVEFKLIGDLTMRQFTYLLVFGLIAYIVYLTVVGVFKWPITLFFCLIGLALAFIPIQERGLDEWIVNFMRSVYSPSQRIWKKEPMLPIAFTYQSIALVKQELITLAPTSSRRKLEEYLEIQQKQYIEDRLDIPEKEYVLKVRQAFTPVTTSVDIAEEADVTYTEQQYETSPEPQYIPTTEPPQFQAPQFQTPQYEAVPSAGPSQQNVTQVTPQPSGQSPAGHPAQKPSHQPSFRPQDQVRKGAPGIKKAPKPQPVTRTPIPDDFMATPMTPDRHAGRKFTSLLPSEGQLILPVRGEKILETSEELNIQKDIQDKTDQLKQLLDQIKSDSDLKSDAASAKVIAPTASVQDGTPKGEMKEAATVVKQVKAENERLSNEIQKLKTELDKTQMSSDEKQKKLDLINKLEKEQSEANTDYTALQRQVLELQKRLKEKEDPTTQIKEAPKKASFAAITPITSEPNIISGIVKNPNGEALPGIVLLIKNSKKEAVRALKTNALGQFSISTALLNGLYTIEIGSSVPDVIFDIITVEVKGEIIPPIEVTGRVA